MEITRENVQWAIRKLSRFRSWRNFPTDPEEINSRARAFLRLVHNRPLRELCFVNPELVRLAERDGMEIPTVDWKAKGMDPEQSDVEWILDLIEETMDTFPLPVEMREIYTGYVPPAVEIRRD
jgi:hypothetical protein